MTSRASWLAPLLPRPVLGTPESRRRVLHGDWHPLLRDWIDVLRLHYVVAAVVFFALGDASAALRLTFSAVAVLLVRAADPPRRFDLVFIVAMAFNGWGDALHLFTRISWYDNVVHVTLPLAVGPLAYIALVRLDVVPPFARENTRRHRIGMGLVAAALGVTGAAAYEVYEYAVDAFLGQHLFISEADTANDLFDGFLGAGVGGVLLASLARTRVPVRRGSLSRAGGAAADERGGGQGGGGDGEQAGGEGRGVRGGAAEGAVEHDAGCRPERRTGEEVPRADAGEAAGVVEEADREAGRHPHERHGADAALLQAGHRAREAVRQPAGEVGTPEQPAEAEGGQRPQRTADDRQGDARGTEQQARRRAQQRPGDQQRRADDPRHQQRGRREGAGGRDDGAHAGEVVRGDGEQGTRREGEPEDERGA